MSPRCIGSLLCQGLPVQCGSQTRHTFALPSCSQFLSPVAPCRKGRPEHVPLRKSLQKNTACRAPTELRWQGCPWPWAWDCEERGCKEPAYRYMPQPLPQHLPQAMAIALEQDSAAGRPQGQPATSNSSCMDEFWSQLHPGPSTITHSASVLSCKGKMRKVASFIKRFGCAG